MESTGEIARLEARLKTVERRSRWTAGLCVVLGALALAGFTQRQPRVVRAEKFELVNARGEAVSEWSAERGGPRLQLGRLYEPHVAVGITGDGNPALQVVGEQGQLRINLGLERDVNATALFMYGPEPVTSSVRSGIILLHAPRHGPSLHMTEQNRTVFRVPTRDR